MSTPSAPEGYSTVNSFIITADAPAMISFLERVFGAKEVPEAHTLDDDGMVLHAELRIGDSTVMVADRKPDWPFTPSLLQVYVNDIDATLKAAQQLGAIIATNPTDFYGDVLARFEDPWSNLWWVYQHSGETMEWDQNGTDEGEVEWSNEPTPELTYIHGTLLKTMRELGR